MSIGNDVKVGQKVALGRFPQSDVSGEKKDPVDWLVLAVEDGKALLISEKGLDCRMYHGDNTTMTWENCDLRKWLNGEFLQGAFTAEEQAQIVLTPTPNPGSTVHGAAGGNDTEDKVFLLNVDEADKYFTGDAARMLDGTPYTVARGAFVNERTGRVWWWLRSPGYYVSDAAGVNYLGQLHRSGDNVSTTNNAVRPAMWVQLS
ncbi:MAG: DUF6273 domain-containing protein [Oscillospiraceae bacterium]|nr:DUF6273 domain-containing protein [Oscillospiraceae bacterium]